MSVINQMLQELEQRKAEGNPSAAQIRAVRAPGRQRLPLLRLALAVATVAAAGAGYWLLKGQSAHLSFPTPPTAAAPPAVSPAPPAPSPPAGQAEPSVLQLAPQLNDIPPPPVREEAPAPRQGADQAPTPAAVTETPAPAEAPPKPPAKAARQAHGDVAKEIIPPTPHQRAENAYRLAYGDLQQGRMSEAEDNLRQALQSDPRHAAARQALAALLVDMKRLNQAEQLLQEGLQLQPGNTTYAMSLARIQVELGDTALALSTLENNPPAVDNAEYHGFAAALLQRSGRHKDAIEQFQAALRLNPDAGAWLLGLGISLQADNQNAKAADAFHRARQSGTLTPELNAFADQRLKQLQ